jgi:uncharacterized protein YbjT (DUF2867 family)
VGQACVPDWRRWIEIVELTNLYEVRVYIVMGATGNKGSVVAKELLACGQEVRASGRSADRLQPLARLGAEPFVADVADAGALTRAFAGAQAAYVMIPPNMRDENILAHDERVSDRASLRN